MKTPTPSCHFECQNSPLTVNLHLAKSSGYVEDCEELLEVVDLEMDKTDTRIEIEVVRGIESTTVSWLVVEFACHLIYVDIVKYFTVKKNVLTPIPKIAMLQFTRARAKELGQR
ncbi:hypothetical protein PC120_g15105 [Phytophthora cactorum]|nr:hypothetical protein PC120_g15105 [Phytophthora cactorum]